MNKKRIIILFLILYIYITKFSSVLLPKNLNIFFAFLIPFTFYKKKCIITKGKI